MDWTDFEHQVRKVYVNATYNICRQDEYAFLYEGLMSILREAQTTLIKETVPEADAMRLLDSYTSFCELLTGSRPELVGVVDGQRKIFNAYTGVANSVGDDYLLTKLHARYIEISQDILDLSCEGKIPYAEVERLSRAFLFDATQIKNPVNKV